MSVTAPKVPRVVVRATTPPLVVRLLPLASFNCTVMVDVVVPFARMLVGLAVIVEVVSEALTFDVSKFRAVVVAIPE